MRNRVGTNPVTAVQAASTSTAVSRRTRRPPVRRGPKLQLKCRPSRPRPSPRHRHEHQNPKRTSPGRARRLVASSRARGPHGRSVGVESRLRFRSQVVLLAPGTDEERFSSGSFPSCRRRVPGSPRANNFLRVPRSVPSGRVDHPPARPCWRPSAAAKPLPKAAGLRLEIKCG
jgi:hypothetical protein